MLAVEQLFALPNRCGVSERPRRALGPSCPRGFRWWRKTRGSGMRQPQALGTRDQCSRGQRLGGPNHAGSASYSLG